MEQFHWSTAPALVRHQVNRLVSAVQGILGESLFGVYLHGSLCWGCFQPQQSDVDVLFVSRNELGKGVVRRLAETLLTMSGQPCPLEVHVLTQQAVQHWVHPLPFAFHYSELWRAEYERQLTAADTAEIWCPPGIYADYDLAAHFVVVRQSGIALQGPDAKDMFPVVPRADYVDAILSDVHDVMDSIPLKPVYCVLNLCRVLQYLRDGTVASKDQGGTWGVARLPARWQRVVAYALASYRGELSHAGEVSGKELEDFGRFMLGQINRVTLER